jgi:menaquinone-dependent protoporphyrinogen oxidase
MSSRHAGHAPRKEQEMTVLVTTASKHGATREIAKEIARVLDEHGVSNKLLDIDDVTDLSGYEAYVVGSGIYLK